MSDNMDISKIHINPNNPRIIKDGKFEKLCNSIQEFPKMLELRPIIVDSDGMILGGNMRFKALQYLKMDIKPEWVKEGVLSDEEKRRFVVEDNVGFGEWNWDELANAYGKDELEDWGLDVEKWAEDEIIEDEPPAVEDVAVSVMGEVYQLGRHRLMCGDSTKIEDVEKLMNGQKADVGITDPPYGVRKKEDWDEKNHFIESISDWFGNFRTVCNQGLIWFCAGKMLPYLVILDGFDRLLVWNKPAGSQFAGASNNNLWYSNEPILVYDWNGLKKNCGTEDYSYSVFESRTIPKDKEGHPTTKPIELMSWLIKHYSQKEQIVLDLFGGSGSTLIACEQLNRTCYMMELDPKYCDVIRKRYAKFIGKEEQWQEITPIIK